MERPVTEDRENRKRRLVNTQEKNKNRLTSRKLKKGPTEDTRRGEAAKGSKMLR